MNADLSSALRAPFPKTAISKLDRGNGLVLDYVGHAAVTARLLEVDPTWTWEPLALDDSGLPKFDDHGGLWIRLTIVGHTRIAYGDAAGKKGPNAVKEAIGDAIRNGAMRFGVGLDLWSKEDLSTTFTTPKKTASEVDVRRWLKAISGAKSLLALQEITADISGFDIADDHREQLITAWKARQEELRGAVDES